MSRLCAVAGFMHDAFRNFSEGVLSVEHSFRARWLWEDTIPKKFPREVRDGFRVTLGSNNNRVKNKSNVENSACCFRQHWTQRKTCVFDVFRQLNRGASHCISFGLRSLDKIELLTRGGRKCCEAKRQTA